MNTLFRSLTLAVLALLPAVASAALQNGKVQVGMVKGTATLFDPAAKQSALRTICLPSAVALLDLYTVIAKNQSSLRWMV